MKKPARLARIASILQFVLLLALSVFGQESAAAAKASWKSLDRVHTVHY